MSVYQGTAEPSADSDFLLGGLAACGGRQFVPADLSIFGSSVPIADHLHTLPWHPNRLTLAPRAAGRIEQIGTQLLATAPLVGRLDWH
jgi:hypothetical protein